MVRVVMMAESLVFVDDKDSTKLKFPTEVSPEDDIPNTELGNRAFRRRVAMHTLAVGMTMGILLDALHEVGAIKLEELAGEKPEQQYERLREICVSVMCLHDLKKLNEINWRGAMDVDMAYDLAEKHLNHLLTTIGFSSAYADLAGSIGHNGAKDFLVDSPFWNLLKISAYLCDELLQEVVIQLNPWAKVIRLQSDKKYIILNKTGFAKLKDDKRFIRRNGILVPKFSIQAVSTTLMLRKIGSALGIEGKDLGKFLIKRATELGVYKAKVSG